MSCLPDLVTYNSLIDGHGMYGALDEAGHLLSEMRQGGVSRM